MQAGGNAPKADIVALAPEPAAVVATSPPKETAGITADAAALNAVAAPSSSSASSSGMPTIDPLPAPPLAVASAGAEELMLDPSLFDVQPPPTQPRAMLPIMHQLDVSVQGQYSQPASSSSDSPATPYTINFGLADKDSMNGLSRPPSMGNLSTYGATKGTLTSVSSESGVDDVEPSEAGAGNGGVPAPKAKKSHARKVRHRHNGEI